jgi:hypothetical protein
VETKMKTGLAWLDDPEGKNTYTGITKFRDYYDFYKEELDLYEGLITTYSIESTLTILTQKWSSIKIKRGQNSLGGPSNDFSFNIELNNDINLEEVLIKLNTCGWFISTIDFFSNKKGISKLKDSITITSIKNILKKYPEINNIDLYVEAKYDLNITRDKLPRYLYHIIPSKFKKRIEKIGLLLKSNSKRSAHPDRIYLAVNKEIAKGVLFRQLKSDYENKPVNAKDKSESGWIILTIDIWGLPQHQRFFRDLNYEYGVYTLWNIPHQEIIKIEDL